MRIAMLLLVAAVLTGCAVEDGERLSDVSVVRSGDDVMLYSDDLGGEPMSLPASAVKLDAAAGLCCACAHCDCDSQNHCTCVGCDCIPCGTEEK